MALNFIKDFLLIFNYKNKLVYLIKINLSIYLYEGDNTNQSKL